MFFTISERDSETRSGRSTLKANQSVFWGYMGTCTKVLGNRKSRPCRGVELVQCIP